MLVAYQVFSEPGEPGGSALYVYEKLLGMEEWASVKLLDKTDYIGFEYFSRNPEAGSETWVNDWGDPSALPEKVRISFRVNGRDLTRVSPLRARTPLFQKNRSRAARPVADKADSYEKIDSNQKPVRE